MWAKSGIILLFVCLAAAAAAGSVGPVGPVQSSPVSNLGPPSKIFPSFPSSLDMKAAVFAPLAFVICY